MRRRHESRDRVAARRDRQRDRTREAGSVRGHRPGRAAEMRLGVEAALVDGVLVPGDVEIVDGAVAAFGLSSPAGRGVAAPGFVDLQVNGLAGLDCLDTDADGHEVAGSALLETG